MIKRGILILIALVFLISSVSCSGTEKVTVEQLSPPEDAGAQQDDKGDADEGQNKSETESEADNKAGSNFVFPVEGLRPYAVMIDNEGVKSLPQGGLYKAQVIYEIIVEGGETRLMPVFWGTEPEMIGPVRSSRHYFLDYVMEHDAIYVHFGWSPMAMKDISKFKINNINGVANGGEIFWDLTKDKGNWQDSYTSAEKIKGYVSKVKYRTGTEKKPVFTYNKTDVEPSGGQKAENIAIRYSHSYTCGYTYDSSTKMYKRLRKGQPQIERLTGEQLEAKNIIIQYAKNSTIKGDDAGRQEVATVGGGDGWFISCGKAVKIKWSKDSRSSPTRYVDEKGNAIVLNPGQTWIQVVPTSGKVEIG